MNSRPAIALFLSLAFLPSVAAAQSALSQDYRFEEGAGTALTDSVSNTIQGTTNATFSATVPASVIPLTGATNTRSLALSNSSPGTQSASFTSDFVLNRDHPDATLQFSVRATANQANASVFWTTSNNDHQDVIPNDDADNRFNIYLDGQGGLYIDYREPGNFSARHLLTPTPLPVGNGGWANVVVTRTGGNSYTFYVNGQEVQTYTDPDPNLPTANSTANPWTIAGRPPGGANADLTGLIDEVAFADTALDPSQFLATPTVTLTLPIPSVAAESGNYAEFLLTLPVAQSTDTIVNYQVKGTATNGTDYVLLKGTKKIKAGKTSKPIKVIPEGDLGGASKKTVVLTLKPGSGYAVGTTGKVKAKITAPNNVIILP